MTKERKITLCRCSKESEISEIHTIVKDLKPKFDTFETDLTSIKNQISYYQGSIATWKIIAGGSGFIGIISLIMTIVFHFA
jgi:uncharacterized protein YijF (DUF1287 family)